jgi:hypothetical protein
LSTRRRRTGYSAAKAASTVKAPNQMRSIHGCGSKIGAAYNRIRRQRGRFEARRHRRRCLGSSPATGTSPSVQEPRNPTTEVIQQAISHAIRAPGANAGRGSNAFASTRSKAAGSPRAGVQQGFRPIPTSPNSHLLARSAGRGYTRADPAPSDRLTAGKNRKAIRPTPPPHRTRI